MSKLYFRYGAMNCGKSTHLLQVAHNYEQIGKKVLVCKPKIDTKADDAVSSRIGIKRKVDFLIDKDDNLLSKEFLKLVKEADCILIDEAQFLSSTQVFQLFSITKELDIPVIAYGLRTRVNAELFTGSGPLLALADSIEELKSICSCGNKATMQIRYINGVLDMGDTEVVIDSPENNVNYVPTCGRCYILKRKEYKEKNN